MKSGEIQAGKAFKAIPALTTDGCTALGWIQWEAEISLLSEVPERVKDMKLHTFLVSQLAYRDSKSRTSMHMCTSVHERNSRKVV